LGVHAGLSPALSASAPVGNDARLIRVDVLTFTPTPTPTAFATPAPKVSH